jgi:hypothetical protein
MKVGEMCVACTQGRGENTRKILLGNHSRVSSAFEENIKIDVG